MHRTLIILCLLNLINLLFNLFILYGGVFGGAFMNQHKTFNKALDSIKSKNVLLILQKLWLK